MSTYDGLPERIRVKIQVADNPDDCYPWLAYVSEDGYGRVVWEGAVREAHRVVFALLTGEPIPDGLVIDHTCHNPAICKQTRRDCPHRRCMNRAHMNPVTRGANALRGSSPPALNAQSDRCGNGHLYVPGSFTETEGHRRCLICRRKADKRRRPRGVPRKGNTRTREFRPMPGFPSHRV